MLSLDEEKAAQKEIARLHSEEQQDDTPPPPYNTTQDSPTQAPPEKQASNTLQQSNSTSSHTFFKAYAIYNDQKFRTFAFWNVRTLSNLQIHAGTTDKDPCTYYVRNCEFTPRMPDVLLFNGPDQTGPVCATAKFHKLNGNITLAVGEGSEKNGSSGLPVFAAPVYEEMKKVSFVAHSEYRFSTDLTGDGVRREYVWRRKGTGKNMCWDYQCLDFEGEIVARFENAGLKWSKSGDFRFVRSEGMKWEWLVLVAFLSIREKENRFAARSNGIVV